MIPISFRIYRNFISFTSENLEIIILAKSLLSACTAHAQLNPIHIYTYKLEPTTTNLKIVKDTIKRFKKTKMKKWKNRRWSEKKWPKKNKNFIYYWRYKPGCPVLSSVNYHTNNISKFVDYHLQSIVKKKLLYVNNTQDFLKKFREGQRHTSRKPSS